MNVFASDLDNEMYTSLSNTWYTQGKTITEKQKKDLLDAYCKHVLGVTDSISDLLKEKKRKREINLFGMLTEIVEEFGDNKKGDIGSFYRRAAKIMGGSYTSQQIQWLEENDSMIGTNYIFVRLDEGQREVYNKRS